MKLMIAGSRSITDVNLSLYVPQGVDMILSGGAIGVDTLAERYADEHKLSKLILRPRYDLYGRSAPLKRNDELVAQADAVLVIWDGVSRGTCYTIKQAKAQGKPLRILMRNPVPHAPTP